MTRHRMSCVFLSFILILLAPGIAMADLVQGRVASVNSSVLNLTVYDAQNRPYPNALRLNIDNLTRMTGYSNAMPPRVKDMVRVHVSQKKNGQWHADSISKLRGTTLPPSSQTQNTPAVVVNQDNSRSP